MRNSHTFRSSAFYSHLMNCSFENICVFCLAIRLSFQLWMHSRIVNCSWINPPTMTSGVKMHSALWFIYIFRYHKIWEVAIIISQNSWHGMFENGPFHHKIRYESIISSLVRFTFVNITRQSRYIIWYKKLYWQYSFRLSHWMCLSQISISHCLTFLLISLYLFYPM